MKVTNLLTEIHLLAKQFRVSEGEEKITYIHTAYKVSMNAICWVCVVQIFMYVVLVQKP